MPSRNAIKIYETEAYYHVYNRGVEKRKIFLDDEDYSVFLNLLKRYLSKQPMKDSKGREYDWYVGQIEVNAYCLMPNHFHLLLYQTEYEGMTRLLRAVTGAYTTYFNKKYKRSGTLFQGRFKACRVKNEGYLLHISRYIHLNPRDYRNWEWSSLKNWLGKRGAEWVHPERLLTMEAQQYADFVKDHEDYRNSLEGVGTYLADL